MKAIEERAKLAQTKMPKTYSPYIMFREGYIQGAKEQKPLDIEGFSKRIYEFFGENGGVEFNGSWWDVNELEEALLCNLRKE